MNSSFPEIIALSLSDHMIESKACCLHFLILFVLDSCVHRCWGWSGHPCHHRDSRHSNSGCSPQAVEAVSTVEPLKVTTPLN